MQHCCVSASQMCVSLSPSLLELQKQDPIPNLTPKQQRNPPGLIILCLGSVLALLSYPLPLFLSFILSLSLSLSVTLHCILSPQYNLLPLSPSLCKRLSAEQRLPRPCSSEQLQKGCSGLPAWITPPSSFRPSGGGESERESGLENVCRRKKKLQCVLRMSHTGYIDTMFGIDEHIY